MHVHARDPVSEIVGVIRGSPALLRAGDGTLLDKCIIMMWGSGLEDGNRHSRENLPFRATCSPSM